MASTSGVLWNRNWHPLLRNALKQMQSDGIAPRRGSYDSGFFGSYSGCRQYREDIARAQQNSGVSGHGD